MERSRSRACALRLSETGEIRRRMLHEAGSLDAVCAHDVDRAEDRLLTMSIGSRRRSRDTHRECQRQRAQHSDRQTVNTRPAPTTFPLPVHLATLSPSAEPT